MRALPSLLSVLVSVLIAAASTGGEAQADPVTTIWHLAPQADGATAAARPTTPVTPLLGDVAGPAREISLPELLELAVRTSPALAQARIDRLIAAEAIVRAQTWRDWTLEANATVALGGIFSDQGAAALTADLSRRLSTGGTLSLHAGAGWQRFPGLTNDRTVPPTVTPAYNVFSEELSATFAQPLMRGKGKDLVLAAERVARHQQDAVTLAERAAAIAAVRDVVLGYLDLVAAETNLQIQRSSLDLARERLRVTEAGIRAGGVAESETISVEQAIATREDGAMTSELQVIDQSLSLRRLVALPIDAGEVALASRIDLAVPARTWDGGALIAQALATSPELARLAALDAGATIEIDVTEHGVMPSLDLVLTLGPAGSGSNPGAAAKNLVTLDDLTALASLTYRTTIGERATRSDVRGARLRRQKLQVTAEDVKRQLVEGMTRAVAQVQTAERRFGIAARAVKLAEKNLAVEQARLGLGRSRNVDVLIRQDELRAAQLRASQAVIDWHRAATAIAALTGELLPTYGIELREP